MNSWPFGVACASVSRLLPLRRSAQKKGGFDDISEEADIEPGAIPLGAIRCPWEKERRCWEGDWPLKKAS